MNSNDCKKSCNGPPYSIITASITMQRRQSSYIFRLNSINIGLLPIEASEDIVEKLFKKVSENPKTKIEISIEQKFVVCEEIEFNFFIDDFSQNRILNGIDKIDISLEFEEKIDEFMQSRNKWAPKLT